MQVSLACVECMTEGEGQGRKKQEEKKECQFIATEARKKI